MSKFVWYSLVFVGGVMLNVAGGLDFTEWQWWAIAMPITIVASLT